MTENLKNKDPFHGITLEMIVNRLAKHYGWEKLGELITIKCFIKNQSVPSCLKFLRQTPWARAKVEDLYLATEFTDEEPVKVKKVKNRPQESDI
ncbi:VF530 family protein [Seleniivibrio woodruffii]|uniref:VF530 family protein n=1 Tax=Seleniivibrio woodruffii TaxID=1078050 RepID=UPI0026EDAA0D|nr:VF530 family protein [Seleniivibrio woodruffii]